MDVGKVSLGGSDIKDMPAEELMDQIAYVSKDNYLFNASVMDNIRMGCPAATDEEVVAVAKASCCHDFIEAFPDGYNTIIGESGATVSGGEKQRSSIACAMLKDAPIIILDEATANVTLKMNGIFSWLSKVLPKTRRLS